MKLTVRTTIIILPVLLLSLAVFAAEKKTDEAETTKDSVSEFQCRKVAGDLSLSDVKLKLMENCNLNKPFSLTSTGVGFGGSGGVRFCCHSKK